MFANVCIYSTVFIPPNWWAIHNCLYFICYHFLTSFTTKNHPLDIYCLRLKGVMLTIESDESLATRSDIPVKRQRLEIWFRINLFCTVLTSLPFSIVNIVLDKLNKFSLLVNISDNNFGLKSLLADMQGEHPCPY